MSRLKIEQIPIGTLTPYAQNARTHSRRQIRKIAKSIEKFGFVNPILIGDDLSIIAGHGRVAAAKLLGHKKVPALRLSHLNDAERRPMCSPTTSLLSMPAGTAKCWSSNCKV